MRKWVKVFLIVIALIVVIILGIGLYLYWPYLQSEPNAILNVEKGNVYVDSGKGFVNAKNEMQLKEGWIVRTDGGGEAEIIFLGSASVRLDESSSLIIKKIDKENRIVSIEQGEGDIWYDILEGSGIRVELETPDGNFTNEGTSFGCSVSIAQPRFVTSPPKTIRTIGTIVPVIKGSVVQIIGTEINRIDAGTQGIIVKTYPIKIEQVVKTTWIENNKNKYDNFVEKRREELKKKYARNIAIVKKIVPQLTDEMLNTYINKALIGEIKVNDKIKDGTIPASAVRFIPPELITVTLISDTTTTGLTTPCPKRYRVNCEALLSCTLIYSVVKDNNFMTWNQEHIDQGREQVKNIVADLEKGKSDDKKGQWTGQDTYTYKYELATKGWGVGCNCAEALSTCVNNMGTANTKSISFDYVKGTFFSTNVNCGAKNPKQISCEEIK